MPRYNYVALDTRGQEASGLVEAASTNAAITQLRQAGYFPTSVIEEALSSPDGQEARQRAAKMAGVTKPRAKKGIVLFQRRKVKGKILMIFTRQLATLIDQFTKRVANSQKLVNPFSPFVAGVVTRVAAFPVKELFLPNVLPRNPQFRQ